MDLLLRRYRSLTVLIVAVVAQLLLLSYQIKSNQEVRLIRLWAVSVVTPAVRAVELTRSGTAHFFKNYFDLLHVREDNARLQGELDQIRMENYYLRTQLDTAELGKSLAQFQAQSKSVMLRARVIANTTDSSAREFMVDRGAGDGVRRGMAVITPSGIVGKITNVFPNSAFVLEITDPTFAAGVVSQKGHIRGILHGQGSGTVTVGSVQNEQNVETGEWFYTSGDDRIFPKGLPAGIATAVRQGKQQKEIYLSPSAFQNGLEVVLIVTQGQHTEIPPAPLPNQPVQIMPPPAEPGNAHEVAIPGAALSTDADRIRRQYLDFGTVANHAYGAPGSGAPNFNAGLKDSEKR